MIAKLWASVIFSAIVPISAFADTQEIVAECTTEGTDASAARHSCYSKVNRINDPNRYVFAEKSLKGGLIEKNGSECHCCVG